MGIFKNLFDKSRKQSVQTEYIPYFDSLSEIGQITSIYYRTLNPSSEASIHAAKTVHRLLVEQTTVNHISLYHSFKYLHLYKEELRNFRDFDPEIKNSLYCVASMNGDGYVREEALRFLVESPTHVTFPFILIRLADWVPSIRSLAENGVRNIIHRMDPELFVHHHKTIDWLLNKERYNLAVIHQEIMNFIFSTETIGRLLQSLNNFNDSERYFIYKNIIARNKLDEELLEKILTDKFYLIRLLAIRNVKVIEHPNILKKLLRDKNQRIRAQTINKIPDSQLKHFQLELEKLLFDLSAYVRAKSRFQLSKFSNINFYEHYQVATRNSPSAGAILGLSEVGNETEIQLIREYIDSDSARLRDASLRGIANLDYDQAKELAFELLHDSSITIKKTCIKLINNNMAFEDLSRLRDAYDKGSIETKRYTLKAISLHGGWSIPGDYLKGLKEPDERLNEMAFSLLKSWYSYASRLYTELKTEDKEYVMGIYNSMNLESLKTPRHFEGILENILLIFKR